MAADDAWVEKEDAIARLLPGSPQHDRRRLLAELTAYSTSVVAAARRRAAAAPPASPPFPAWLEQPVFVCGAHRSGTTLLQRLLDGHPELMVLPSEATYLTSFGRVAGSDPDPRHIDAFMAEWINRMIDPNDAPHFKLGHSTPAVNPALEFCERMLAWRRAIEESRPALSSFAMLLALAAAFKDVTAPRSLPRMWVEKTPLNEFDAARFDVFKKARFIQMVRAPGATLSSLQAAHRSAGLTHFDAAGHIRVIGRSLQLAIDNARRYQDRYLVVRYEDLIRDPEAHMRRVQSFLGIGYSPLLLTPTAGGAAVASNSSFAPAPAGLIAAAENPTPAVPRHDRMISALIGPAARALGYEMAPLRPGERLRIRLERSLMAPMRILRRAATRPRHRNSG